MSHSKAEVVSEVLRAHYAHCFHLVAKNTKLSSTNSIPEPEAARGTVFEQVTCVVEDISIRMNMFGMGSFAPLGRHLVEFVLAEVHRAFKHRNIHTYVLASDMSCFGVESKEPLQEGRLETARKRAASEQVAPFAWDIDDPQPIVSLDKELPPLVALQACPGAVRQALYEAMRLIGSRYKPPAGKRLILHMEPRYYTNPATMDEFMPNDPLSTGIVICSDRADVVEAAREQMRQLSETTDKRTWRRAAREMTTALARSGCFHTIPLCIETSISGQTYAPFRLPMMKFQAGEADLSIQRYVTYLYSGFIVDRLAGDRRDAASAERFADYYTAEQAETTRSVSRAGPMDLYVGEGGRGAPQRTAVVSTDSDFCALLTYTFAILVAGQNAKLGPNEQVDGYALLAPHAPLLVRGDVLTRTRATLRRGERRKYYSKTTKSQSLLASHEIFDVALFYSELTRGTLTPQAPIDLIRQDAAERARKTSEKRARSAAAKRSAANITEATTADSDKKRRTESGAVASGSTSGAMFIVPAAAASNGGTGTGNDGDNDDDDDDEHVGPLIHVPPPRRGATADQVFQHVASFVMFTCMLGNDYLGGLPGVPRRWAYAAYVEMTRRFSDRSLVNVLRLPGENDIGPKDTRQAAPMLPLIINCGVHARLIDYCYYFNLIAQPFAKNRPTVDIESMTSADVARCVAQKYSETSKHVPNAATVDRMARRLLWVLSYFTCGTTNLRLVLNPIEFGWEGEWRRIIL